MRWSITDDSLMCRRILPWVHPPFVIAGVGWVNRRATQRGVSGGWGGNHPALRAPLPRGTHPALRAPLPRGDAQTPSWEGAGGGFFPGSAGKRSP